MRPPANSDASVLQALKLAVLVIILPCLTIFGSPENEHQSISGWVRLDGSPVAGAVVRVQATDKVTSTDKLGRFTLALTESSGAVSLTASALGCYIAGPFLVSSGDKDVTFHLKKHPERDKSDYSWVPARGSAPQNCQSCHSDPANQDSSLPFDEWVKDAHSGSATNQRFLSIYYGTDLSGKNRSPLTRYVNNREYGKVPLPPDPSQPFFGPGFKLDFPDVAGDCAACHLPAAAAGAPYETDPNRAEGVGKEGVTCDVCHKIWSLGLNSATGSPFPNTPGVLSIIFRRPDQGHQLFLGPYDDVAPGEDSYSPLQKQGRICAPCHFAQFWGVQIYNSYGEWLNSPYSDPVNGKTCQDCHMPRRGAARIALKAKGGIERRTETVFSHLMPGAADTSLLKDTALLDVMAVREDKTIRAQVKVRNQNAGHYIPTDHPARNILLVVTAISEKGDPLRLLKGPVIPDWGGVGDELDDYGGKPGRGFAKILEELWTETTPTVAYWNPTVIKQDTRIPTLGSDVSDYEFEAPVDDSPAQVTVRLIFRRAFKNLLKQKRWQDQDVLMNEVLLVVP